MYAMTDSLGRTHLIDRSDLVGDAELLGDEEIGSFFRRLGRGLKKTAGTFARTATLPVNVLAYGMSYGLPKGAHARRVLGARIRHSGKDWATVAKFYGRPVAQAAQQAGLTAKQAAVYAERGIAKGIAAPQRL